MSTIIQIKRSTGAAAPTTTTLAEAELAYSQDKSNDGSNAILYIESVNNDDSPSIHRVGGKYYTGIIEAATADSTASTLVLRGANGSFSANVVTANEFVGNISGTVSGKAGSAAIADTANALTTARYIFLAGDVSGNVAFDGSSNVTIQTTANINSVELGTDTTGDYVQNVDAGTGIVASGGGGEGSDITISLENTAVTPETYGGTDKVGVFTVDQQGRITEASNVTIEVALGTNTSGNYVQNVDAGTGIVASGGGSEGSDITITLSDTAVTPTTYGGSTQIPAITVDQQGRITSAANVAISTSFSLAGDHGTPDTFNTGDTLSIVGGTGISTAVSDNTITVYNEGVVSLSGTANEIEVSASNGTVTIGLPDNITIGNDLVITGNLTVNGNAVIINTESKSIADPLLYLAANNTISDTVDIGFVGDYYDSTVGANLHTGFFRDATDKVYKLFSNVTSVTGNEIDTNDPGFAIATLNAHISQANVYNLLNPIAVPDGGTGNTSFVTNGVLYGQGTSAISTASGSSGEVLQINASGIPIFASLDGGTY